MTQANPKIPLAGVIGAPIAHSKSPRLHGHWLQTHGIAGHYVPLDVQPEDLARVLDALPRMGFVGVNVTLPHKEAALGLADEVTEIAQRIGAANTLSFKLGGGIHADNTDAYGFIENLRSGAPDWDPTTAPAVVLGAGGAARAVLVALLDAGVPGIMLANRTRDRAETLAQAFGPRITVMDWEAAPDAINGAGVLVNTTSLGMTGKPPLEISLDALTPRTVVTDIVYVPLETDLLARARRLGCTVVDGLGMLLHQGVPGFERWFGARPDVDERTRTVMLR